MPSTSAKQARTMAASAHDAAFAKKMGIPQDVAKEFNRADVGSVFLKAKRPKAASRRPGKKQVPKGAY